MSRNGTARDQQPPLLQKRLATIGADEDRRKAHGQDRAGGFVCPASRSSSYFVYRGMTEQQLPNLNGEHRSSMLAKISIQRSLRETANAEAVRSQGSGNECWGLVNPNGSQIAIEPLERFANLFSARNIMADVVNDSTLLFRGRAE